MEFCVESKNNIKINFTLLETWIIQFRNIIYKIMWYFMLISKWNLSIYNMYDDILIIISQNCCIKIFNYDKENNLFFIMLI